MSYLITISIVIPIFGVIYYLADRLWASKPYRKAEKRFKDVF